MPAMSSCVAPRVGGASPGALGFRGCREFLGRAALRHDFASSSSAVRRHPSKPERNRHRLNYTQTNAASMGWPKRIAGAESWKGVKFDEFTFELKKCKDGTEAERFVRSFCFSDGLTSEFCESALDLVVLAHNQKRPVEETAMLTDLATALLREFRKRTSAPEVFLADELLRRFTSEDLAAAKDGDREAAARLAGTRQELRRVFLEGFAPRLNPGGAGFTQGLSRSAEDEQHATGKQASVSRSKFLTRLEKCKNRAADDARRQRSVASAAIDANELEVQEYVDPMDELRVSGEALRETARRAEMLQEMFRTEVMRGETIGGDETKHAD